MHYSYERVKYEHKNSFMLKVFLEIKTEFHLTFSFLNEQISGPEDTFRLTIIFTN